MLPCVLITVGIETHIGRVMITLQELCGHLNKHLEVDSFKDGCPNGLQVEGAREIRKIAMGVSSSLNVITKAVESGAQALVVHHGLFWNRDDFPIVGTKRKKLALLIENNISLLAYHLPLDAHKELGNNWKAANDLNWSELEPFGEYDGRFIGVKGKFPKISRQDFQKQIEKYYGHAAQSALGGNSVVGSCALISGGAYRAASQAAKEGVDCFITGNFDEPVWHTAFEEEINFFAMGHSSSERVGPKALGNYIESKFGVETVFLDEENPF